MKRYTRIKHFPCVDMCPAIDFNTFNIYIDGIVTYIYGEAIDQLYKYEETGMTPKEILDMKRELEELRDKYDGLQKKRVTLAGTNSELNERIGKLEKQIARLKTDRAELENENKKLKEENRDILNRSLQSLGATMYDKEDVYKLREDHCKLQNENDKLKDELKILKDANEVVKKNTAFYQKQYVETKKQLNEALKSLDEKTVENKALLTANEGLSSTIEDLKKKLGQASSREFYMDQDYGNLQAARDEIKRAYDKLLLEHRELELKYAKEKPSIDIRDLFPFIEHVVKLNKSVHISLGEDRYICINPELDEEEEDDLEPLSYTVSKEDLDKIDDVWDPEHKEFVYDPWKE